MKNVHILFCLAAVCLAIAFIILSANGSAHARAVGMYSLTAACLCWSSWPHPDRTPVIHLDTRPAARQTVTPKEKSA